MATFSDNIFLACYSTFPIAESFSGLGVSINHQTWSSLPLDIADISRMRKTNNLVVIKVHRSLSLSKDVQCAALKFPTFLLNLRFTRRNANDFAESFLPHVEGHKFIMQIITQQNRLVVLK